MKKIVSLLLAVLMIFGLTACAIDQETVDLAADVALILLEETESKTEDTPDADTQQEAESSETSEIPEVSEEPETSETPEEPAIAEDGVYSSKEDVALYLYTYGKLPSNFMTKKEAKELGWTGGGLDDYADGMCIGGDRFGNYEKLLPEAEGRTWQECDIDTLHADTRGAKRIVFSNDGLIYYTDDHYESFTLLYGDPDQ